MRAKKTNIGIPERAVRVALGGALAIWMVISLFNVDGLIWLLLEIALMALGVDFVVTGLHGYCPLYNWLGWTTAKAHA
jgi:hypothetical protein